MTKNNTNKATVNNKINPLDYFFFKQSKYYKDKNKNNNVGINKDMPHQRKDIVFY